jgi:hypothetical protein
MAPPCTLRPLSRHRNIHAPRFLHAESSKGRSSILATLHHVLSPPPSLPSTLTPSINTKQTHRHDWSDTYCIAILSVLKPALTQSSRILLCEQVMNTTLGFPQIPRAPEPLPANYGAVKWYSHQRDLTLMSGLNGIERTPGQFRDIVEKAGLKIEKFWQCRSQVGLIEVRLG